MCESKVTPSFVLKISKDGVLPLGEMGQAAGGAEFKGTELLSEDLLRCQLGVG